MRRNDRGDAGGTASLDANKRVVEDWSRIITPQSCREGVGGGTQEIDQEGFDLAIVAAFGDPASVTNGSNRAASNLPLYIPPGSYKTSSLVFPPLDSGLIYGGGDLASKITMQDADTDFVQFNGLARSTIRNLAFVAPTGTSTVIDYDWTGPSTDPVIAPAAQSNLFEHVWTQGGGIGWRVGKSGYQTSENLWKGCNWINHGIKAMNVEASNSLLNNVLGGNMTGCVKGFCTDAGEFASIVGVAFQNQAAQGSTDFDIELLYSALSAAFIAACRSESLNFARFDNGITYHVAGCHHTGPGSDSSRPSCARTPAARSRLRPRITAR